jgi:hypothetical protein
MQTEKRPLVFFQFLLLLTWDYLWLMQYYPVIPRQMPMLLLLPMLMLHVSFLYSVKRVWSKKRITKWEEYYYLNLNCMLFFIGLSAFLIHRCLKPNDQLITCFATLIMTSGLGIYCMTHALRARKAMHRRWGHTRFYGCTQ